MSTMIVVVVVVVGETPRMSNTRLGFLEFP